MTNSAKSERSSMRWLLCFYDIILFCIAVTAIFVFHPSLPKALPPKSIAINAICGFGCIFSARISLHIYNQIWRYGSGKSYILLFAADSIGGALYFCILYVLRRTLAPITAYIPVLYIAAFCAFNLLLTLFLRFLYYALFVLAKRKTAYGELSKKFLTTFARVDFDSEDSAAILHNTNAATIPTPINQIQRIARQFCISGEIVDIVQLRSGYINTTYRVHTVDDDRNDHYYTLQRINTNVFPDVDALMSNFTLVTDYLHDKFFLPGHSTLGSVQIAKITQNGIPYFRDDNGCWRMLIHFYGVHSLDIPDSPKTFYYAGQAFGRFIRMVADIPVEKIATVIPNFHNTASRYRDLEESIAKDAARRVHSVEPEIAFIRARKEHFSLISDALDDGRIPYRICHNDCNLNNILFDDKTGLPVAIIDLDTVMPSSPLYDFGDSMRIGTNTAKDDEKDLSKVSCDLNLYEQYARGWLEECGSLLSREELALLPYSALIITAEDGIRFLMDHIDGDTYYSIFYPGQNLDRSRTQLKLLGDMEAKLPKIKEILRRIYTDLKLDVSALDLY